MEDIINFALRAGSLCSALATISAFCVLVLKPVRKSLVDKIRKIAHSEESERLNKETNKLVKDWIETNKAWQAAIEAKLDQQRQTDIVQLRNVINELYDNNYEAQSLTLRQKELLVDTFDQYKNIGGNHNAEQKYNEMIAWKVRI